MISKNDYSQDWSKYFYYDNNSPSGIRWRTIANQARSIKVGDIAGTKQYRKSGKPSKWMVKLLGKNYSCAKIVFILNNGYVENNIIIDHIDLNPFNNKIENLRAVTETVNLKNKSIQVNNSSGFIGVSVTTSRGVKCYVATWMNPSSGKQQCKSFNTKMYGDVLAKIMAVLFRYDKLKEFDTDGIYSSRHYNYIDEDYRSILSEAADELMHQQNETLRWKAEYLGVWPASDTQRVERLSPMEGYKELSRKNNSLVEEVATLREQLAEVSKKLEDYRDLDSLLCK